jgi:hypothetical protein
MRIAKTTGLPDRRGWNRATHGDNRVGQRHPLYKVWAGILRRCDNPNEKNWERYGGRGIKVCDRWRDYINFKADMGATYARGLSIERNDNDGHYEPGNCRWATRKEQARNRRSSFLVDFAGSRRPLIEWTEYFRLSFSTVYQRIKVLGWPVDEALFLPNYARR